MQSSQPRLELWRRDRLKHDVITLDEDMRLVVENEIAQHCKHRRWRDWAKNARKNHVHVVVTATGWSGKTVRDQLKANCTRGLREGWPIFQGRPVWTVGGDWDCINNEDELRTVIEYVLEAQDKKHLDLD